VAITVNQQLLEAQIGHQVDLAHYSNAVVQRMAALLNRVEPDLFNQLVAAMQRMPADSFTVERLDALLTSVRMLNAKAYTDLGRELPPTLAKLAKTEVTFQNNLFTDILPLQLRVATVSAQQVYAAAMARPMQGRLLKDWVTSIEAQRMARIRDALRIGYVEGQTIDQMVQRIRGTRALGYSDGIIEIDRRHAEAVVRTAIGHTAAFTRNRFYQANDDLVKGVQWVSTLDLRTTEICIARDGLEYTMDGEPIGHDLPWLGGPGMAHWNCRSMSTPIVKSWEELGYPGIPEFKPGTRSSMDGQVPAELTYADWLAKQSPERQDRVLGTTRGAMLRSGDFTVKDFFNDKGIFLDLDQLQAH